MKRQVIALNYYIADLHLGHENIIKFSNRPFANAEEMDEFLIDSWNARVTNADDIFVVGDLIYRSSMDFCHYLDRLAGHKHLILGNHDLKLLNDKEAVRKLESADKILTMSDGDQNLVLCHYPMAEWPGYYRGRKHFFGHIHNKISDISKFIKSSGNAYNVRVDSIGPMPLTAKEIIEGYSTSWNAK